MSRFGAKNQKPTPSKKSFHIVTETRFLEKNKNFLNFQPILKKNIWRLCSSRRLIFLKKNRVDPTHSSFAIVKKPSKN